APLRSVQRLRPDLRIQLHRDGLDIPVPPRRRGLGHLLEPGHARRPERDDAYARRPRDRRGRQRGFVARELHVADREHGARDDDRRGTDLSAPFSAAWMTPAFDGPKALRAVATDQAGNTGSDVHTVTIDRTAPTGVTVSYGDGYASGPVTVTTNNGSAPDVDASTGVL